MQAELNLRHFIAIAVIYLVIFLEGEDKPLYPGLLTKPVLKLGWTFLGTHLAASSSPNFTLLSVQTTSLSKCIRNSAQGVHLQLQPYQVAFLWP